MAEKNTNWLDENRFDAIILGTGLIESLLAAALALQGKKVLHMDKNDFYGSRFSTLTFSAFHKVMSEGNQIGLFNCEECDDVTSGDINSFFSNSGHYNIDLNPKLFFCEGEVINTLIRTNVSRYLEFRCIQEIYLFTESALQLVPSSKSDIFKSKYISLLEKRTLTKFLQRVKEEVNLQQSESSKEEKLPQIPHSESKFVDFLNSQGLSDRLQTFIFYSIAFLLENQKNSENEIISKREGLQLLKKYIDSLGRYGNTPFLTELYGINELTQAFCRLSAVYGGTYVLRRYPIKFLPASNSSPTNVFYEGIVDSEGQTLYCDFIVANLDYFPEHCDSKNQSVISRCVCITEMSLNSEKQELLIVIPPNDSSIANKHSIHIIQLSHETCVSSKGKYLVHFITKASCDTAKKDLEKAVKAIFQLLMTSSDISSGADPNSGSRLKHVLYCAYYNQTLRDVPSSAIDHFPSNVFLCRDPSIGIDCTTEFEEAKRIFSKMYPSLDYMPKVPNPEDLVWDNEEQNKATTGIGDANSDESILINEMDNSVTSPSSTSPENNS